MDKYEYKVKADEIRELIAEEEYVQAADIADTIDWRRVKNVMMLCTISDLYKMNRRYEDAKNMLLLAYERRPGGKTICYSLCELCIKTEEFLQAVNYYKEFVQVAPKDPGRYILQYKLYEVQEVGLEERIGVLEELKKRDYREKWAYELAYLYHRVGLATRCVEECDEMILWFGEGKYVIKAMELKMLHQPLSADQQEKYDRRFEPVQNAVGEAYGRSVAPGARPGMEMPSQALGQQYVRAEQYAASGQDEAVHPSWAAQGLEVSADTRTDWVLSTPQPMGKETAFVPPAEQPKPEELDIQVKTMDLGAYNTINLQAEIAAGLQEVLLEDEPQTDMVTRAILAPMLDPDTESFDPPEIDEVDEDDLEPEPEIMEGSEVFFGETGELLTAAPSVIPDQTAEQVMDQLRVENARRGEEQALSVQPPRELAGVLSQEPDGQISLVVPESEKIEKQITGQMNFEDILNEWEKIKRENEARRQEEVRRHVLQQTGNMFTEFEASVRDGLLEQLESDPIEPGDFVEMEPGTEESFAESAEGDFAEPEALEAGADEAGGYAEPESAEAEAAVSGVGAEGAEELAAETVGEAFEIGLGGAEELEESEESGMDGTADLTGIESAELAEAAFSAGTEGLGGLAESEGLAESKETEESEGSAEPEELKETPGSAAPKEMAGSAEAEESAALEPEAFGQEAAASGQQGDTGLRPLTREEKELYAPFIQSRAGRERLIKAIDSISMAAYTGNVIITADKGVDTLSLARGMIREFQMSDRNFSGKVAKISGQSLNTKDVEATLGELECGALIVQTASQMEQPAIEVLQKVLQREHFGIIIFLEDTKKAMDKLLAAYPKLQESFTARMDVEAMSNDALVAFGRQYAKEMEHSIDELGILALHTRIEERQTLEHVVTAIEAKEIVDAAIRHAGKKNLPHFFDILLGKRYDEEDMVILTEKDFV